jgi:DNA mismatch repair protein MutL
LTIKNLPVTEIFSYPGLRPDVLHAAADRPATTAHPSPNTPVAAATAAAPWSWCRVVGQVGGLYVILETEDGTVVMDPHAAHERVLFDRFMTAVANGKVEIQSLLMPESVELQPHDAVRVRENIELLRRMGFGISEFGGDTFLVDGLPAYFAGAAPAVLLTEAAQHLDQAGARGSRGRRREESIAQAACKAAVKARDQLTLAEIERLVVDLAGTEMPYTCPHGRPTLIFTSFKELHRKFARE